MQEVRTLIEGEYLIGQETTIRILIDFDFNCIGVKLENKRISLRILLNKLQQRNKETMAVKRDVITVEYNLSKSIASHPVCMACRILRSIVHACKWLA